MRECACVHICTLETRRINAAMNKKNNFYWFTYNNKNDSKESCAHLKCTLQRQTPIRAWKAVEPILVKKGGKQMFEKFPFY